MIPQEVIDARRLTPADMARWCIGYDRKQNRVTLPTMDIRGAIVGCTGRAVGENHLGGKYYHYPVLDSGSAVLYGEHLYDATRGPLVLVEGNFDAIALSRRLPNVLALQGSKLTPKQLSRLTSVLQPESIILLMDNDDAGLAASESIANALHTKFSTYFALLGRFTRYKDADSDLNAAVRACQSAVPYSAMALEISRHRAAAKTGRFTNGLATESDFG
jgi:DNA primase